MTTGTKTCRTCGRRIEPRRKWRESFDEVRYCGERCRRNRPDRVDRALECAIDDLLDQRGAGRSICPSEAARVIAPDDWRPLMERARMAARRLVAARRLEMTQGGRVVDPSTARGPVRLRRPLRGAGRSRRPGSGG
jgi:hypothetical protein